MQDRAHKSDTTAHILQDLVLEPHAAARKNEETASQDIESLATKYPSYGLQVSNSFSNASLKKAFIDIAKMSKELNLAEEEQLTLEKYKLALMKILERQLVKSKASLPIDIKRSHKKYSPFRYFVFIAFLLLEFVPMIWGSYLGITGLMSKLPWLSQALITATGLLVCGIEAVLYYAVKGPLLKRALGIFTAKSIAAKLDVYEQQLQVLKNIDRALLLDNKIASAPYQQYVVLAKLLTKNQPKIEKFRESPLKKGLRWFLSAVDMSLNIGGGYFLAASLLAGTAATGALLGTPLGWGIIGVIIIGQFALRLAVGSNAMFKLLNPEAEKHSKVAEEINNYAFNAEKFDEILTNKKRVEKMQAGLKQQGRMEIAKSNPHVDSYKNSYLNLNLYKNSRRSTDLEEPVLLSQQKTTIPVQS